MRSVYGGRADVFPPSHPLQDTQWSETGDRYLLKLFRDFVFHQTDEAGAPLTDWGHVVEALNKVRGGGEHALCVCA